MNLKVAIWTEGGRKLGMGHITRSLNIAWALKLRRVQPTIYINDDPAVKQRLEGTGVGYKVCDLNGRLSTEPPENTVIIDTKRDISDRVAALQATGKHVILIDNMTPASKQADAVVIPSPLLGWMPGRKGFYSGADYLVIGENFHDMRRSGLKLEHKTPLKVLVTFGGSDPAGLTAKTLAAIWNVDNIDTTVVVGPVMDESTLKDFESTDNRRIVFVRGVNDISPLMQNAHVCFTAVGQTLFEAAFMGTPPIVISANEGDAEDLEALRKFGFAKVLGFHEGVEPGAIREGLSKYVEHGKMWAGVSDRCSKVTDGFGADRIATIVKSIVER